MAQKNFWQQLKKPIMALAPMANVTDSAFRQIIAKYGKPDVFWSEFISADGLCSAGRPKLEVDLYFSDVEHPIVLQIFGSNPENFYQSAKLGIERGFDGIDINMGCPDRTVEKQGAGAALIKNPSLAKKIIIATQKGAGGLPVSVKTRIGYNQDSTEEWVGELLKANPAAITLHARTRREMSLVPAHWDAVKRAVQVRDQMKSSTLILGNGDVNSLDGARVCAHETGADGIMLGRGIFGNPWLFSKKGHSSIPPAKRLTVLREHVVLFEALFGENSRLGHKNFATMKKHFKAYVSGFKGAKELRVELMHTKSAKEVTDCIKNYICASQPIGV